MERDSSSSALVQRLVNSNPSQSRGKHEDWKDPDSNTGPNDFG